MKKIILFVLCLLTGLMFINAGLNKFFNYMPMPKSMPDNIIKVMTAFMTIGWLFPLVGTIEVIGGILLIIPRTRALGVIVLLPIMVGILIHTIVLAPSGLLIPLVLFAIILWAMMDNWKKYMVLIS